MTSENSLDLITWSSNCSWTEVGAELIRRTLPFKSRAAWDQMSTVFSGIPTCIACKKGHQRKFHCFCSRISLHPFPGRHNQLVGGSWNCLHESTGHHHIIDPLPSGYLGMPLVVKPLIVTLRCSKYQQYFTSPTVKSVESHFCHATLYWIAILEVEELLKHIATHQLFKPMPLWNSESKGWDKSTFCPSFLMDTFPNSIQVCSKEGSSNDSQIACYGNDHDPAHMPTCTLRK